LPDIFTSLSVNAVFSDLQLTLNSITTPLYDTPNDGAPHDVKSALNWKRNDATTPISAQLDELDSSLSSRTENPSQRHCYAVISSSDMLSTGTQLSTTKVVVPIFWYMNSSVVMNPDASFTSRAEEPLSAATERAWVLDDPLSQ